MERKQIQEQRIRNYFIEATREILKGEGLKSVNVRAIADRAGYSYATLYNYFKDIKELVFICVEDFKAEAEMQISDKIKDIPAGKERIKSIVREYVNYFTQYPGIFDLFFLEKMSNLSGKHPTAERVFSFLDRLTQQDWNYCSDQKIFTKDESLAKQKELKYSVTGLLLLYMNRMHPESYTYFIADLNTLLDAVLE